MNSHSFFTLDISGHVFHGVVGSDGPYIEAGTPNVPLGYCTSIERVPHDMRAYGGSHRLPAGTWCLAKCASQPRISLHGMSDAHLHEVAHTFGISIERRPTRLVWSTPAFAALQGWVRAYPRKALRFASCDKYLPGWYARARGLDCWRPTHELAEPIKHTA